MHITHIRTILYRAAFRSGQKTIMTTPRKLQEVIDDLKVNPYFDKYANKIAKLQKAAPEEFTSRVEDISKKKSTTKIAPPPVNERSYSQLLNPKQSVSKLLEAQQEESLDKIMKIDLIKDKSAEEIKVIWQEYHIQKEFICATIPSADYDRLLAKGKQHPTFLFPLPRSQGYEFIMCQFQNNAVHFTPLLYYQVHKENAPECLTIKHYTDFKESKGVVLMRGEYDKNIVDAKEAQCLANQLKLYYTENDPEKDKLLETFTQKPSEFKHGDLLKQIESLTL